MLFSHFCKPTSKFWNCRQRNFECQIISQTGCRKEKHSRDRALSSVSHHFVGRAEKGGVVIIFNVCEIVIAKPHTRSMSGDSRHQVVANSVEEFGQNCTSLTDSTRDGKLTWIKSFDSDIAFAIPVEQLEEWWYLFVGLLVYYHPQGIVI